MVQTKRMVLEIEIEIDVPMDIVEDEARIEAVEEGLGGEHFKGSVRPRSVVSDKETELQDQVRRPGPSYRFTRDPKLHSSG